MKTFRIPILWLVIILSLIAVLAAQTQQGRILGRVTDASGAVVPNATVTIQNTETGTKRVLETNSTGDYFAPNLNPGVYSVTVAAPTFKTAARKGIRLEVATDVRIDMQLQPGQVSEVMEVTGEQPLVETVNDTLGGTMTNKLINELPLQGRDFQNLLELRPGVQRTPGGGFHSVSSNGNRLDDNNYMVDGTDNNDLYYGDTVINGAGVQGTPASHLPLDAIQEFNTQENPGADYGWKPGAVVNIGLKGGTNDFHGTAYYFHRNAAFDARNWFNAAPQPLSPLLLHDFGASAGGPIVKDKWFIFGNYEGVRHKVGNPYNASSPVTVSLATPANPDGNIDLSIPDALRYCNDPVNGCTPNPLSMAILPLYLPNPGTLNPNDPSQIDFLFNNLNREDNFIIKTDYNLSDHHHISGHYFYGNSFQTEEDTVPLRPEFLSTAVTRVHVTGVNWTWTPNSRWVNEARFGYNRNYQKLNTGDNDGALFDSLGINSGITDPRLKGFFRISISPFDYFGGNSSWPLWTFPDATWQFVDNATYTRGAHSIKLGGEFRYGSTDNYRAPYGRGRVRFRSLTDFIGGFVRDSPGGAGYLLIGDPGRQVSMKAFGAFVQDDWRVRPRLTLNLGLRYDLSLPIKEAHDQIANFDPARGIVQVGHGIDSPYDTDWNNFSPRVGLAWDVFGTGRTVFRVGGSIIFEQPSIITFINSGGLNLSPSGVSGVEPGNGTITTYIRSLEAADVNWNINSQPIFLSTQAAAVCDWVNLGVRCDVPGVKQNLATPYVTSWNFNLQQELTRTTVLQVGYVASHGIKLYSHRDINQVNPNSQAEIDCGNCEQEGRPLFNKFSWLGFTDILENGSSSEYNSLQATLTQRAWKGLNFLAGYTWAHAIDTATSNRAYVPQDSNNYAAERGNGDYDIRHRFTLSLTYDLPNWKAPAQLGEGWSFTSIVNLQSGEPYYFYDDGGDISLTGELADRWNFFGNPDDVHWSPTHPIQYLSYLDAPNDPRCAAHGSQDQLGYWGCFVAGNSVITPPEWGQFGNMPRNIFRGPAYHNWDMSVSKRWKLGERASVQFRGEVFNILNTANFDVFTMSTDLYDTTSSSDPHPISDLGLVHGTPDVGEANPVIGSGGSRHIQLGVKFIW
jgi:hypothetical protein